MCTDLEKREIDDCLRIINKILPLLSDAEDEFSSARTWGFFDIMGGGLLTDLIKHSKIDNAANCMNEVNDLLRDLEKELKDVKFPTDYSMDTMGFATFADFFFDGILADLYMQSKIIDSMEEVEELTSRLEILRDKLVEMKIG